MIIGVGPTKCDQYQMTIGTHNGIFHPDEVLGVAILGLAHSHELFVVRTRDPEELKGLNIVIDVGGGPFDHHQKGFDARRSTGESYASAGLVWEEFGYRAVTNVLANANISPGDYSINRVHEHIDRNIIIPVDLEDNGVCTDSHPFTFISSFNPSWLVEQDYDKAFFEAVSIASAMLENAIINATSIIVSQDRLKEYFRFVRDGNGILEIDSQTMPWLEEVVGYNKSHPFNRIKFVIFPYPAGGWAAQCVPPSIRKKFKQLVPFPKEWAGRDAKSLPELSGVIDATFCHNGRFFARAETKAGILALCHIAMGQ